MCVDVHESVRDTGEAARPDLRTIQQSLIVTGVTLYARATQGTRGRGQRGAIDIYAKLTEAERADHSELITLRNRVFAHVHTGEEHRDGIWHQQWVFALADEAGPIGCVTRNIQTRLGIVDRLRRAIPIAIKLVSAQTQKHIGRATIAFNECAPRIAVDPYLVSAEDYFGGEKIAREVLAGRAPGAASILFTEDHII